MRSRIVSVSTAALSVVALAAGCGSVPAARHGAAGAPGAPASSAAASSPASPASTLNCADIAGVLQPVVSDANAQDQTFAQLAGNASLVSEQNMAAQAWTDPGAYSRALDSFLTAEAAVTPDTPSDPSQLSGDVATVAGAGHAVQQDMANGGSTSGQPVDTDYPQFQAGVVATAHDCGLAISAPWT